METTKESGPHRRSAMRLREYDYSSPGIYFVTICTARRKAIFGQILNAQMRLNAEGRTVEGARHELPQHYAGLGIDAFVVMPNHIHRIIILNKLASAPPLVGAGWKCGFRIPDGLTGPAPTRHHGLTEIVRAFKTFSARSVNALRATPGAPLWQRGYYDHIIRRGDSLDRIRRYIHENPLRWAFDPENPQAVHPDPEDPWART